jgi:hypothetical protein
MKNRSGVARYLRFDQRVGSAWAESTPSRQSLVGSKERLPESSVLVDDNDDHAPP